MKITFFSKKAPASSSKFNQRLPQLLPYVVYAALVITVCIIIGTTSCAFSSDGFTMISGDYSSPVLEHFTMDDGTTATMSFSREVTFPRLEYYVLPQNSSSSADTQAQLVGSVFAKTFEVGTTSKNTQASTNTYTLTFPSNTVPGTEYILSGTVKDAVGSTLRFTLGFSGFNSRVPYIVFSEINTEHAKPRTEFIEFYVLEDGNLGGMVLQSAGDGIEDDYIFPAIEVSAGEYVVLHMRSLEEGLINETGNDLTISAGRQASATGRDLWIPGTKTRLSTTDVLLVRKRLNGPIIDAVLYAKSDKTSWTKDLMTTYARDAYNEKIWNDGFEITTAASTDGSTTTRTLSRQNISEIITLFATGTRIRNKADDWIIVATSNASPGKSNSNKAHIVK